ncbi:DEAD-box ATP-dependent RNA helicase 36 isoform X2 [Durio zibethinus]|uniref:DEAD-box ATP-dependent RNA helicase 36 isoform X2 n=1 Tax=Durio zibethinus TaxID=66656 RepID=A0A6P5WNN1_DURZI|nr:DEAD-box ATP-dependent RNA helicase 36 isoform X2 [Durio zibethinus]
MDQEGQGEEKSPTLIDKNFPLFSRPRKTKPNTTPKPSQNPNPQASQIEKFSYSSAATTAAFSELGLGEWAIQTCKELGMRKPTPVQTHCIPKILAGRDVLGIAQTGSGKTAAFALPILHRLAEDPYGVFALVITPTRELAFQLAEQFRALGSCLHLRCSVVVGGMDMITQAKALVSRPHVVVATPGRVKVLLEENPDIPKVFQRTKFLVLDEADRVLDAGFEEELRVVFQCLPKNRQTLLFSATMTGDLQTLLELSANKAYFYEAYEGFRTVETLKEQYIFIPKTVKDAYLVHILSKMEDMNIRSAIIFVSRCRDCHLLSLLLEELEVEAAALHSLKSQALRLSAVQHFKSGRVSILLATDVASRGLDIPAVDLVINYDLPRYPRDYVHRVGRTARAGRGGLAVSFITENDVDLVHEIEAELGKQLEKFECKENEVLSDFTKVCKAKRVATMKMMDDGFEEKVKERKKHKLKTLADKGLLKKRSKKRKRDKSAKNSDR